MSHVRQQIRDAVVTALTGLTTTETRVSSTPVYAAHDLPGLEVATPSEETIDDDRATFGSPGVSYRALTVTVSAYARGTANVANTVDTILKEVEVAMAADRTLDGTAEDSYYTEAEFEQSGDGEQPVVKGTATYLVHYRVADNDPETLVT